jgi:hypothetical protein
LICGILSLPVFYTLARNLYGAKTALLVLALIAFMPSLIRYSNEAKQYMGDVLWAGIIFWSTERTGRTLNPLRWTELSILGVCALFFSHADKHEEIRKALEYLDRSLGPYDKIYFSRGTGTVLEFYLRTRPWHEVRVEQLQPLEEDATPELPTSVEGKNIGVVLGHVSIAQTEANFMEKLSTRGHVIGRFTDIGSEALVIATD